MRGSLAVREGGGGRVRVGATGVRGAAFGGGRAHLGRNGRGLGVQDGASTTTPVADVRKRVWTAKKSSLAPRPARARPARCLRRLSSAGGGPRSRSCRSGPDFGAHSCRRGLGRLMLICQARQQKCTDCLRTPRVPTTRARASIGKGCWVGLRASRSASGAHLLDCASVDTMSYSLRRRAPRPRKPPSFWPSR